jgi:hypothetical protein
MLFIVKITFKDAAALHERRLRSHRPPLQSKLKVGKAYAKIETVVSITNKQQPVVAGLDSFCCE